MRKEKGQCKEAYFDLFTKTNCTTYDSGTITVTDVIHVDLHLSLIITVLL